LNDFSSVEPNRVGIKHSPITGELFSSVSQICAGIVIFLSFVFETESNYEYDYKDA